MTYFTSPLHFQVWDHHVSYSRLLLRAPRDQSDEHSVDIDVTFTAVNYVELCWHLEGIVIRDADAAEQDYLHNRVPKRYLLDTRCYTLESGGSTYFIVGGNITIETSRMRERLV